MAPLPSWLSCCAVRDGDEGKSGLVPLNAAIANADSCNEDAFYDCAETLADLIQMEPGKHRIAADLAQDCDNGRHDYCTDLRGDCTELLPARAVLEGTLELFGQRVSELAHCGPELEWADLSAAKRMLRATELDAKKAVEMFVQALELRAQYRNLFQTLHCQTCCDIRVFTRDLEEHPVIYMCARSLLTPIGTIRDQFMVTFEAACRATTSEGKVTFVIDMFGMRPHLYMDPGSIKDLANTLGTVFAERIHRVVIVDFSRAAQAAWWLLKPLLTKKTRDKFAFVGRAKAEEIFTEIFTENDCEKMRQTLTTNRDPKSSAEERAVQARRTTMCDVPLGPPLK